MRYGYMYEDYMMKDAIVLNPINGSDLGLRDRVDLINKDTDLQAFVEAYAAKAGPVAKDAAPYEEYLMVNVIICYNDTSFHLLVSSHRAFFLQILIDLSPYYSRRKLSQSLIRGRSLVAILQSN